jgi:hypothetical protein
MIGEKESAAKYHIVLLCFALDDPESLSNIATKWPSAGLAQLRGRLFDGGAELACAFAFWALGPVCKAARTGPWNHGR